MSSAGTPLRSVAPHDHDHAHGHDQGHAHGGGEARAALTLLTSGLAYRLGSALGLAAVLWAVVLWALA